MDIARARDKLDQLRLNDSGKGDLDEDAVIVPGAVDLSYEPFCRAVARSNVFGGSVHFPYDWRKGMRESADAMCDTILGTYDDYGKKVYLVGHSIGGLMIRTTLMIHGKALWPKVDKIVYIGTPHYGSPSIAGYLKNHLWGWEQLATLSPLLSLWSWKWLPRLFGREHASRSPLTSQEWPSPLRSRLIHPQQQIHHPTPAHMFTARAAVRQDGFVGAAGVRQGLC